MPAPDRRGLFARHFDEYWPLMVYIYLYPLWWVLGISKIIVFVLSVPMLWALLVSPPAAGAARLRDLPGLLVLGGARGDHALGARPAPRPRPASAR
ncbi:MAG: hypothetical protein R2731_06335 [Nocardioides sp.]